MASINKVIIIGNLGADPEMRYTQDGKAVANFSLATSETWKDKQSGEKREKTEWHRIVAFGRVAEVCGEYLSKGRQVYIEGKLQTRQWEDKDGVKRYTTEIIANQMTMLGSRSDNNSGGQQQQKQQRKPEQSEPTQHRDQQTEHQPANQDQGGGSVADDIPF